MTDKKYKFLFISAFCLPEGSPFSGPRHDIHRPKEERLQNHENIKHLLEDVEWDMHSGPVTGYGDWTVENRQEFLDVAAGRLPIVKEACESGKYDAIILEGGGEPGFLEARELTRRYGIPVVSCGHSQMHLASILGNKFVIIDFSEVHNMHFHNLVVQHRMTDRCASIRNLGYYHPKPFYNDAESFGEERRKAFAGERSEAVERAVAEATNAMEEDGADVVMFGCSGSFWLKPFVEKRLHEDGWDVPVIEGYGAAIQMAKMQVNLGLTASGLAFPSDRPKRRPRKIVF
jgi:Asp/Glu/hydantoin racemase